MVALRVWIVFIKGVLEITIQMTITRRRTGNNHSTIAAGSSNGLTSARCCRYSCVCSWWWVEIPSETCRAVSRDK